jgi:hypothetical protein
MPGEILMKFWSYLDFDTVQKTCTRVSKSWLGMIRSSKLSWEMKLRDTRPGLLGVTDFNAILSQWEDLRELHFSSEEDFAQFRFSLNSKKSLEKIVIPSMIEFRTKWTSNGFPHLNVQTITKYWIDPKHLSTPLDEIKNVIELKIRGSVIHEEFAMRQNGDCDFTYLEKLEFSGTFMPYDERSSVNFVPMLSRFKELKNLETGHFFLGIYIDCLLDILRFLGDMKNLKISVCFEVLNGFHSVGEEATKEIFIKALEIVREKFPFPDSRILKLEIREKDSRILKLEIRENRWSNTKIGWKIYGESGAIARLILPDGSLYVLRDSEDEN